MTSMASDERQKLIEQLYKNTNKIQTTIEAQMDSLINGGQNPEFHATLLDIIETAARLLKNT